QLTYKFDDVVATLNKVFPYDWATFLKTRLDGHGPGAPLDGLTRGGYKLVYTETPTAYFTSAEVRRKSADLTYSLGLSVNKDGDLLNVFWEGPAFDAGLSIGQKIVAVNGWAFDQDRLKAAVTEAKTSGVVNLIVKAGEHYKTVQLAYKGGLRYPRLERIAATPDRLGDILEPRKD
ncbi:MAG: peptidase M61, partial [Alphaproteobacteria bacterium]